MEITEKDRIPPKAAQNAAQKVLDWKDEKGDEVNGMTEVGWNRARQIASGKPLSMEVISKIAQFARHKDNSEVAAEYKSEPWKDAGHVAWLGWGGDSAILEWSPKLMEEKKNEKGMPEMFYCKHMLSGVVRYENEDVLVDVDAMKRLCNSFVGKPVYIEHRDVDVENLKNDADGYVTECFYNETDGCLWAKFLAVSDEVKQRIKEGWSVSNAYLVNEWGEQGIHNNMPYKREVKNGTFTHLAVVQYPRYEKAQILTPQQFKEYQQAKKAELDELKNSKQSAAVNNKIKVSKMFKLFKNTREEVSEIDAETLVELENGKSVSIAEMINAVSKKNEEDKKEEEKKEMVNMDMEIEVGEEKMPLKDLINKYSNMCKKENEMKEEEEKKENEEKEKKEEEEKKNSKFFEEQKNALEKSHPVNVLFSGDKVARGKELYG